SGDRFPSFDECNERATSSQSLGPRRPAGGRGRLRRLGGGGMGEVYEAEDCSSGQHVALKLIAPHLVTTHESVERVPPHGRLATLIDHPRPVFVVAADEGAG